MSRVKFIGDFKSLIGNGWTFQKLYAKNYRSYRKEFKRYSIWIWQAGRNLEIDDWSVNSAFILEYILNEKYKEWEIVKGEYEVKHDNRVFCFNDAIADFLIQMKLNNLIEIMDK